MELDLSKDVLFDNIVEHIKNKNNIWYECEISEEKIDYDLNIKFLSLRIYGEKSKGFVININNEILTGKVIKFDVNSLKSKLINSKPYFIIQKYKLNDKNNEIKNSKLSINIPTDSYQIVSSIDEIKPNCLYILILRVKEIKEKTQKYSFQLEDSKKKTVLIDNLDNSQLESGKIYCFYGYTYNSLTLKFEMTNISHMEEISPSMFRMNDPKELLESNINTLLNVKGKANYFNITDKIIKIEDENQKIYILNVNYYLIRQISINTECKFYNFKKKNNEEFIFSNLSFIESKEETFIELDFPFYNSENHYYNKIRINDKYYDINNKIIKVKIEDKEKSNLFLQKVIFERILEEEYIDAYEFDLELEKGKKYHLKSSLEKNGFSYEFYIQSINEDNLPANLTVQIKNNNLILDNPDKNGNKLKERFTIINFPKQDIKKVLGLPDDIVIKEEENNYKYLLMIDNNNNRTLKQFKKMEPTLKKKLFYIPEEIETGLEKASAQCYINFIENCEDQLEKIDENNIKEFSDLIYDLYDGFKNYIFENSKNHYKIIKDIVGFSLNYFKKSLLGKYYSLRKNYELLLDSIINLEYIDRIKILISFMIKFIDSIDNEKDYYEFLHLIDLDNYNSYKNYPYVKDGFNLFFEIIDNLTEDSALFQAIHQFNCIIYEEAISKENQHSGSILNIKDIKLELVKNINRFIFLSEKSSKYCEEFANFEKTGLIVTFNFFSFSEDKNNLLDKNNYEKIKSIILFLFLHECLGNQKKHINNEKKLTQRKYFNNNFQDCKNDELDTGDSLEIILMGKIINLKYFINSKNSEKLLDPKLYLGKDFIELLNIYSLIEKDNIKIQNNIEQEEENNQLNNEINQSPKQIKNNKKKGHLMFRELFQLYSGISAEEKEKLKDDEDYQKYLRICKRKHETESEYLERKKLLFSRLGIKK